MSDFDANGGRQPTLGAHEHRPDPGVPSIQNFAAPATNAPFIPSAASSAVPPVSPPPVPADEPSRRHNGWTPLARRRFLEALSETGNVRLSARRAGFSHSAAYREKRVNRDFARAWEAALIIARDHVEQLLYDRAIDGVKEDIVYHGEVTATRTRHDPRLLLALLERLDRRCSGPDNWRGAVRFGEILDAIGEGKAAAELFDRLLITPGLR
ncbi:MAG: hypothetical protein R3E02_15575 [Blastomonas sp.]